jgi:hypothetical protein
LTLGWPTSSFLASSVESKVEIPVFGVLLLAADLGVVLQPKVVMEDVWIGRKRPSEYLEVSPVSGSKTRCAMLTHVACSSPQPPL